MCRVEYLHNKLFKSDSQRVAFSLCVVFGVSGGMRWHQYCVAHTLTGRYASGRFMEFIDRPVGANQEEIHKLETIFQITLPESMLNWWGVSDGPIVYFGFKELQFFSLSEIYGEDIYGVKHDMPGAMPICLDGNGNICVARIAGGVISGFYVVDSSDLGWEQAKIISCDFLKFVNDSFSPEERLNA